MDQLLCRHPGRRQLGQERACPARRRRLRANDHRDFQSQRCCRRGRRLRLRFQIEKTVLGFENDASWTNQHGKVQDLPPFNVGVTSGTREKWIDMFRGRVGYALDQFLIYGTAGIAFAGTEVTVSNQVVQVTSSQTRTGLAAGLGGEWAAYVDTWGAVTLKLEYVHVDFGSKRYVDPPISGAVTRDVRLTDDIVRAGVNVRFNWDKPVVTKY
ncbi:outer membrane protein [Bradyrhizobium sp. 2TAF36]|uniref:outer membrane protein n=1 Tax=Bradyrhizobium sp. 2TAF36 TaxID=3233016 RepID=UPI003F91583E